MAQNPRDDEAASRVRIPGPEPDLTPKTSLVVGYAPDPVGEAALSTAADIAHRMDAHLHVVHVIDLRDYPNDPDGPDWEDEGEAAVARIEDHVRSTLAAQPAGWTYHAWRGAPAVLLAKVAEENKALMIVVGTHGGGFGEAVHRLISSSVSHSLVNHCHRPVLVVPQPHQ